MGSAAVTAGFEMDQQNTTPETKSTTNSPDQIQKTGPESEKAPETPIKPRSVTNPNDNQPTTQKSETDNMSESATPTFMRMRKTVRGNTFEIDVFWATSGVVGVMALVLVYQR